MPKLNLLVIRSQNPEALKEQYEAIGFQFQYHQHSTGPFHYAHEEKDFVLEIYPLRESQAAADKSLRLGFEIKKFDQTIEKLRGSNWKVLSEAKATEWGKIAILQDLDGRKVELKEV